MSGRILQADRLPPSLPLPSILPPDIYTVAKSILAWHLYMYIYIYCHCFYYCNGSFCRSSLISSDFYDMVNYGTYLLFVKLFAILNEFIKFLLIGKLFDRFWPILDFIFRKCTCINVHWSLFTCQQRSCVQWTTHRVTHTHTHTYTHTSVTLYL